MKIIYTGIIVIVIGITGLFFYARPVEKTGYVELNKVFSDFKLKQELEQQLNKIKQSRKAIIDSLEFELKILSKQIQAEDAKDKSKITLFQLKHETYQQKKEQFEEDNNAVGAQYDKQIITQLNQYVKDYGNKNGYTYILGADGSGFLMFAKETKNITEEVKSYVNDRYKGNIE